MHTYGEIPKVASLGILLLFSLYVALYHALFGAVVGVLRKRLSRDLLLVCVPFAWTSIELARARITGFPWDLLGYTQVDNVSLSRLAPWTGVYGISFVVVCINVLWLVRLRNRRSSPAANPAFLFPGFAALFVGGVVMLGVVHLPGEKASTTASAVLLQENLSVGAEAKGPIETKVDLLHAFDDLSLHPQRMASADPSRKPDIVAWPEAPADFVDGDPAFRASMGALAVKARTPVIVDSVAVGSKNQSGHDDEYNSADFFLADGTYAGRYDKMHLVPFGEYVPYKPLFFFAGSLLGELPFVPGQQRRLFEANGKKYGVFICYESIFGDDIRRFAGDGAQLLVNISDDGWYGDSSAPWEHLDMVRMRAIESHRWIVRATNTGITAAIDPYGRITATMPRHMRGSMVVDFAYENALTFYTRFGDWFPWLCTLVTVAAFAVGFTKRGSKMAEESRKQPRHA